MFIRAIRLFAILLCHCVPFSSREFGVAFATDDCSLLQSHTTVLKPSHAAESKGRPLLQRVDSIGRKSEHVVPFLVHGDVGLVSEKPPFRAVGKALDDLSREINEDLGDPIKEKEKRNPKEVLNVVANGLQDLRLVFDSVLLYGLLLIGAVVLFHYLQEWYPLVYCYNMQKDDEAKLDVLNQVPQKLMPETRILGWAKASLKLDLADADLQRLIGLDQVLLLRFLNFSIELLARVGLPMVLLFCPLSLAFGFHPAGGDLLSKMDMTVLPDGSPLFWIHALGVWYVVWTVQHLLEKEQNAVLTMRYLWLRSLPPPRSTTVLIQNITNIKGYETLPNAENAENQLKENAENQLKDMIDNQVFDFPSGVVEKVMFVKPTDRLKDLIDARTKLADEVREKKQTAHETTALESSAIMADVASDELGLRKLAELEEQIVAEKLRIESEPSGSAFVTFKHRRFTQLFLPVKLVSSDLEFIISFPPDPTDVLWESTLRDPTAVRPRVIGYCLLLGLFILFTPIVGLVSALTKLSYVQKELPFVKDLVERHAFLASAWNALFGSFGLTLFMAMLPTILMWIFLSFFPAVSSSELQLGLEKWYFAFQVVFVVFVTAVSGSVISQAVEIADHPSSVLHILATTLPNFTHFYLNWYVLQWFTQVLGLLRYMNLLKFIGCQGIALLRWEKRSQLEAKTLSEPENQDCYGIGARSAETTLLLVVAIVYCSLSPIICIPALVTLGIARLIYGYLLVYAETRKPDSGGLFWHEQLQQIQAIMVLYILVMVGVISYRSRDRLILFVVVASLPYQLYRYYLFQQSLNMKSLPMLDVDSEKVDIASETRQEGVGIASYIQPEFHV